MLQEEAQSRIRQEDGNGLHPQATAALRALAFSSVSKTCQKRGHDEKAEATKEAINFTSVILNRIFSADDPVKALEQERRRLMPSVYGQADPRPVAREWITSDPAKDAALNENLRDSTAEEALYSIRLGLEAAVGEKEKARSKEGAYR